SGDLRYCAHFGVSAQTTGGSKNECSLMFLVTIIVVVGIVRTTRKAKRVGVICGALIAITLVFVANPAQGIEEQGRGLVGLLAFCGYATTINPNLCSARAEHPRRRTAAVYAHILLAADPVARDAGRQYSLSESCQPRSLDPIHIESGRSPPSAPSLD